MKTRFSCIRVLIFGLAVAGVVWRVSAADALPAVVPALPGGGKPGLTPIKPDAAARTAATKPGVVAVDRNAQVVILCYHRFVEKIRFPGTEIRPAEFEAQMQILKDRGITVIGMQDFLAWKRSEKSIPPRCAIITFDDGWETQYSVAWPILKKFAYPLTVFVYTEGVRGGSLGGGGAITWEQLAEMRDEGVDIEAHSATHQDLREGHAVMVALAAAKRSKKKLTGEEYVQWLQHEVVGCKEVLEQKLALKVNCYAVPFVHYNESIKKLAQQSGYEALFTVNGQVLMIDSPTAALGRYAIEGGKPKGFEDALKMLAPSRGATAGVAEVAAVQLATLPAHGELLRSSPPLITADLTGLGGVDPDTVEMRLSSHGVVPLSYDPKTNSVAYHVTEKLPAGNYSVILSAKADGKKLETRWTFRIGKGGAPTAGKP